MPDKPSIYGKAYDQLNALAQKCEALDLEVRTLRAPVNGRRKDVDYAFDGAKERLSEVLLETLFVMNTIKEEYEDNERLLEYEAGRHGKSLGHGERIEYKKAKAA